MAWNDRVEDRTRDSVLGLSILSDLRDTAAGPRGSVRRDVLSAVRLYEKATGDVIDIPDRAQWLGMPRTRGLFG